MKRIALTLALLCAAYGACLVATVATESAPVTAQTQTPDDQWALANEAELGFDETPSWINH